MPNFLSSIIKQKNKVLFVLLFLVVIGIFAPSFQAAKAYSPLICLPLSAAPPAFLACMAGAGVTNFGGQVASAVGSAVGNTLLNLAFYIMLIPLTVTQLLAFISKTLLIWVFGINNTLSATNNAAVNIGWPIVRNLGNMIIVVALLIISLSTILRWPEGYDAKRLLLKLILVALMINFSLLICGIFIDLSNVTIRSLLNLGGDVANNVSQFTENAANPSQLSPSDRVAREIIAPLPAQVGGQPSPAIILMGKIIGVIFYNTMSAVILFLYVFLFLFRIIALWILVILSPVAFACYILPATKSYFDMWWKNFTQWCIIGVIGAFFFYIGEELMKKMISGTPIFIPPSTAASGQMGSFSAELAPLFLMLVPGFFLIVGFIFALQTSAMGANYAINASKKARGYVQSGLKATGKWAADNTGVTRAKNALQYYGTRAGESLRVVGRGTADANWKEKQTSELDEKNRQRRTDALSGSERVAEVRKSRLLGGTREGQLDRAAMFKAMARDGQLGLLTPQEREEAMKLNVPRGVSADLLAKGDPDLVEHDEKGIQELIKTGKAKDEKKEIKDATGRVIRTEATTARENAIGMLRRAAASKFDRKEINDMQEKDYIALAQDPDGGMASAVALERAVKENKLHKVHEGDPLKISRAIENAEKYGSSVRKSAEKAVPILRKGNIEERQKLIDVGKGVATTSMTSDEILDGLLIREGVRKADAYNAKDYSDKVLQNVDVQLGLDVSKVKAIGKQGNQEAKDVIKNTFGTPAGRKALFNEMTKRGLTTTSPEFKQVVAVTKYITAPTNEDYA